MNFTRSVSRTIVPRPASLICARSALMKPSNSGFIIGRPPPRVIAQPGSSRPVPQSRATAPDGGGGGRLLPGGGGGGGGALPGWPGGGGGGPRNMRSFGGGGGGAVAG